MSVKVLELERFNLASTAESLKLEVISTIEVKVPRNLSTLENIAMMKAVTSRQVWVSRGRGCRIDVEVLLDGKPLDRINHLKLLQHFGGRIQDAEVRSENCVKCFY